MIEYITMKRRKLRYIVVTTNKAKRGKNMDWEKTQKEKEKEFDELEEELVDFVPKEEDELELDDGLDR